MEQVVAELERIAGNRVFATLDLKAGFHQMPLAESSHPVTAFSTPSGLFEFCRGPFGLKNAPPFFQRTMGAVLRGLVGVCCEVFVDDIVVYAADVEEFLINLRAVLGRLRDCGLYLKRSKCRIGLTEVEYLGHLVNGDGIALAEYRRAAVRRIN